MPDSPRVDAIDQLLPQTQCTQCGYPRCREYAAAIAGGEADINQCPPGADITIAALAEATGLAIKPLNPDNGVEEPKVLAYIDEAACIGCKLCIKACPVDCIIGAGKRMHTVIAGECTGCKLCVPVCPTDCISLIPALKPNAGESPSRWPEFTLAQVERARHRTECKLKRETEAAEDRRSARLERRRKVLQQEIRAVLERKRGKTTTGDSSIPEAPDP